MSKFETFKIEVERIINKYSMENRSNTPDFILAAYLTNCLQAFELATNARTEWYGDTPKAYDINLEGGE